MRLSVFREWPTLLVLAACYGLIVSLLLQAEALGVWLTVPCLAIMLALHSSLQHEVLHGHPFKRQWLNELLVFPAPGLFIPYLRFKETHLTHHEDERLTDPYDDPETNYLDPVVWERFFKAKKALYRFNNTLAGRMLIGPVIGLLVFYRQDIRAVLQGDRSIITAYCLHGLGVALVLFIWYHFSSLPFWGYIISAYLALSILKIRTYLEHQAHIDVPCRTVTITDRGPLALLFLNNNYHSVHHTCPRMPWYSLPAYYFKHRDYFDGLNDGYTFRSYLTIFKQYSLHTKDPVPHPLRGTHE